LLADGRIIIYYQQIGDGQIRPLFKPLVSFHGVFRIQFFNPRLCQSLNLGRMGCHKRHADQMEA